MIQFGASISIVAAACAHIRVARERSRRATSACRRRTMNILPYIGVESGTHVVLGAFAAHWIGNVHRRSHRHPHLVLAMRLLLVLVVFHPVHRVILDLSVWFSVFCLQGHEFHPAFRTISRVIHHNLRMHHAGVFLLRLCSCSGPCATATLVPSAIALVRIKMCFPHVMLNLASEDLEVRTLRAPKRRPVAAAVVGRGFLNAGDMPATTVKRETAERAPACSQLIERTVSCRAAQYRRPAAAMRF